MPARRRRTGSESDPPLQLIQSSQTSNSHTITYNYSNNFNDDYLEEDCTEDYTVPEPVMTSRDRTSEFINTIQSLQGRNIAVARGPRDVKSSQIIQNHREFSLIAKNIGRNIATTYTKLEKLMLCESIYYQQENFVRFSTKFDIVNVNFFAYFCFIFSGQEKVTF